MYLIIHIKKERLIKAVPGYKLSMLVGSLNIPKLKSLQYNISKVFTKGYVYNMLLK